MHELKDCCYATPSAGQGYALSSGLKQEKWTQLQINFKNYKMIDRNSITKEVKHVKDLYGGSLHKIGTLDLLVLNGT